MMKTALASGVLLLLLLLSPAALGGEPVAPISGSPLHFRLDVGVEPGRIVTGFLDESAGTGKGYDLVVLDLDGDGKPETRQEAPRVTNPNTNEARPAVKITVPDEGKTWVVDLQYTSFSVVDGKAALHFRWSVTTPELYVWFITGRTSFFAAAEAAAEAEPLRIGPPFRFETGSATRGPEALVRIGLKDVNGSTMRLARRDGQETRAVLRLSAGDAECFSGAATYG